MKYDIIIPCYNSHKTLERALASILFQKNVEEILVTLVNDAGEDYSSFLKMFKDTKLNLREIGYDVNGGPAKARNFGRKNTNCPFIMFMDSDDVLAQPWSVLKLSNTLNNNENYQLVAGSFIEERSDGKFKVHEKDTTFTHGKIYKRTYIEKYDICFNEASRCCEDMSFNLLCFMIMNNSTEQAKFIDDIVYFWMNNENSIGRTDKYTYANNTCNIGFVENLIYLYNELARRNINSEKILYEKIVSMQRCVIMYSGKAVKFPEFEQSNKEALFRFYQEIYQPIEHLVSDELFAKLYKTTFKLEGDPDENLFAMKKVVEILREISNGTIKKEKRKTRNKNKK